MLFRCGLLRGYRQNPICSSRIYRLSARNSASKLSTQSIQVLKAPSRHSEVKKWVIFSDLHVKSSSIDTCEQVLDKVHHEALRLSEELQVKTGIIFLGDFWHARGALSVDLLNRVLKSLQKWTVPVVMIPGNHDQVSLGGQVHALEPLMYAFNGREEQILLISEPSVCMGALWLPYRRNHELLRDALAATSEKFTSGDVSIVFCHADVRGAKMNDNVISRTGVDLGVFPSGIPIYSGHFHKPHALSSSGRKYTYVGSPYQTSLSEAHQAKYLYALSMSRSERRREPKGEASDVTAFSPLFQWGERAPGVPEPGETALPISIGRKYHRASGLHDPLLYNEEDVVAGDRVVLTLGSGDLRSHEDQRALERLRERGVEVDVRHKRLQSGMRIARALKAAGDRVNLDKVIEREALTPSNSTVEALNSTMSDKGGVGVAGEVGDRDPSSLFSEYLEKVHPVQSYDEGKDGEGGVITMQALERKAFEVIHNLTGASPASKSSSSGSYRNLIFERVTIRNFGPFGGGSKGITYPLAGRGLVLLRGESDMDTSTSSPSGSSPSSSPHTGASNGAGKTTLAMSVSWALSGSLDTRLATDGRAVDVTYDGGVGGRGKRTKPAEVTLVGSVNGREFEITRKRGTRKSELSFTVDGKELTAQSQKDTQALIDEQLGVGKGLLQRACFFGQHAASTALLTLTDAKLRSELSPLVQHADLWVEAASACRAEERSHKKDIHALEIELRIRETEMIEREKEELLAQAELKTRRQELEKVEEQGRNEERRLAAELGVAGNEGYRDRLAEATALGGKISQLEEQAQALQEQSMQRTRGEAVKLASLEATLVALRERKDGLEQVSDVRNESTSVSSRRPPRAEIIAEMRARGAALSESLCSSSEKYHDLCLTLGLEPSFPAGRTPTLEMGIASVTSLIQEALAELTTSELQLAQTKSALLSLNEHASQGHAHVMDSNGSTCITCGQPLGEAARAARREELMGEQAKLARQVQTSKQRYDYFKELNEVIDVLKREVQELASANAGRAVEEARLTREEEEKATLEHSIASVEGDKRAYTEQSASSEQRVREEYQEILRQIADLEEKKAALDAASSMLSEATAALQRLRAENRAHQERAKERMQEANRILDKATDEMRVVQASIFHLRSRLSASRRERVLADRLSALFGTRGIQNYVFSETLQQLEVLTNTFLVALSDGELQLAIKCAGEEEQSADSQWASDFAGPDARREADNEENKIVRFALLRDDTAASVEKNRSLDTDGDVLSLYKRRSLSQLSGGQWQRVQLSLDLAFTECVRRRGLLRSNLVVMDEVLTHLDASGREAVGGVLRGMVRQGAPESACNAIEPSPGVTLGRIERSGSGDMDLSESDDAYTELLCPLPYSTVVVILQDFAAAELEESFDHVDIVRRRRGASSLELDGGGL